MNRSRLSVLMRGRYLWIVLLAMLFSLVFAPLTSQAIRKPAAFPAPGRVNPPQDQQATVANYPPRAVPYFEWQAVGGATQYRIQIAQDIGFTQIRYEEATNNTRYLPTNDGNFVDGDWYWRVRVEAPSAGDWPSTPWHFTRNWGLNNAPTLLSPDPGATVSFFESPVFSWTSVIGAAGYRVRIDNDSDCQTPITYYDASTTTYNPSNRLSNGNYFWSVTPYDRANNAGAASVCRLFGVYYGLTTQLLGPANGSFPVYTPQFSWTAVKGAQAYWLYYSTDSTFQAGVTSIRTTQTSFTPRESLPNDVNYYWKVRVEYGGGALGPDSAIWSFQKRWYHKPIILTPRNNEVTNMAMFSWTPVREVYQYRIEASYDSGFSQIKWSANTPNTFYWRNWADGDEWGRTLYVRVRPIDRSNNNGQNSLSISYRPTYTLALPEHIFPRYYYTPPFVVSGNYTTPYNIPVSYNYTVDVPTFYWSRVFVPGVNPRVEASRYRIQVDDDVNFGSPNWTYETENLSATPTNGAPFVPISTTVYYWRVTPLTAAGAPLADSATNQPWAVHIDTSRLRSPVGTLTLQRPAQGEKVLDTMPSFEWLPLSGAARYEIVISERSDFATTAYVTQTIYTHHTPNVRFSKDAYFWRVRGLNGSGQPVGTWSEVRRLVVAYQTRWNCDQTWFGLHLPTMDNTLLATDTAEGGATDLTTLYSAQDASFWYVGFNYSPSLSGQVTYTLYLDDNQTDGQGADVAPPNRPVITTASYYRPEYVINVRYDGAQFDTNRVELFAWDEINDMWDPQIKNLVDQNQVGGSIYISPTINYVELKIPKTAIGDGGFNPFMLSLALFSATSNAATAVSDSVPNNGAGASVLNKFISIADRVTLAQPLDESVSSPTALPYTPYVYAETANTDMLRGFLLQVSRDPLFTSVMDTMDLTCIGCQNYIDVFQYLYTPQRVYEDNTLYWRYWIKHNDVTPNGNPNCLNQDRLAPPSEAHVFAKLGPTPANLKTASSYSTPKFQWDDVETGANYQLQVSSNSNFSPNVIDETTNHNGLTPQFVMTPGKYYWRVRNLNDSYVSAWSMSATVNITLPTVTLLQPAAGATTHGTPTFKWQHVLTPTVQPEWSGVTYHLQLTDSPNGFTAPYREYILDTITFTPPDSIPDKTWYWRAAVRDAAGNEGPYSQVFTFTKQYPAVTLLEPTPGSQGGGFPTFKWTKIDSAASYRIQISTNPQFTPLTVDEIVDNTWFVPRTALADTTYYWRVAMADRNGFYGPYTDATFIVSTLPYKVFLPLVKK